VVKQLILGVLLIWGGLAFGDADALYKRGAAMFKSDPQQACILFIQAANQGSVSAMVGAAHCYETGTGVPVDYAQAITFYEKAVEQNSLKACEGLLRIYTACPDATFLDSGKAITLATALARKNPRDANALMLLAKAYFIGNDFGEAAKAFEQAKRYDRGVSFGSLFDGKSALQGLEGVDWHYYKNEWGATISESLMVYSDAITLIATGKQKEAEQLLDAKLETIMDSQRLFFLRGCLARSRFTIEAATELFDRVIALGRETPLGICSKQILDLDERCQKRSKNLHELQEELMDFLTWINDGRSDEILYRWMFAVQCRSCRLLAMRGANEFEYILSRWDPGPVLVHQTYANILSEQMHQHEKALVHRKIAVELDPRSWTFQGYGNTLSKLGRHKEACEWLQKAVDMEPENQLYRTQLILAQLNAGIRK
jgi:TPR repeat protein